MRKTHRQTAELERLSLTDPLTGAANRRYFENELVREISRSERTGSNLHLVFLDFDYFKKYNDTYGHTAGDRLLRQAVKAWRNSLRSMDILARIGGEEFVVVLSGVNSRGCEAVLHRLLEQIPSGQTCSAGVARYRSGETLEEFVSRADRAVYAAKNSGRDRVVFDADPA